MRFDKSTPVKDIIDYLDSMKGKRVAETVFEEVEINLKGERDEEGEYRELTPEPFVIDGVHFYRVSFSNSHFGNITFNHCVFTQCKFEDSNFGDSAFHKCKLRGGEMDQTLFVDCRFFGFSFQHTTLKRCLISRCQSRNLRFRSSKLIDVTVCESPELNNVVLVGVDMKDGLWNNLTSHGIRFSKVRITDVHFDNCDFQHGTFEHVTWKNIDFIEPVLCNFYGAKFNHSEFCQEFNKWNKALNEWNNLTDENPVDFYLKIVDMLTAPGDWDYGYSDRLDHAIERLTEHQYSLSLAQLDVIKNKFRELARKAEANHDYIELGETVKSYASAAALIEQNGPYLLSLKALTNKEDDADDLSLSWQYPGVMQITFKSDEVLLTHVAGLFNALSQLEQSLPFDCQPLQLNSLHRGSIITRIFGDVRQLLIKGKMLDLDKMEAEVYGKKLENIAKRQEIEQKLSHEELDLELKKQELEAKKLQNQLTAKQLEQAELDRTKKQVELVQMLKELSPEFDLQNYMDSVEGVAAQQAAQQLIENLPVQQLSVETLKTD